MSEIGFIFDKNKEMKRSDFLKRLGIGIGVAVVAPQVLAEIPAKTTSTEGNGYNELIIDGRWKVVRTQDGVECWFKEIEGLSDNSPIDPNCQRGWIFPDKK